MTLKTWPPQFKPSSLQPRIYTAQRNFASAFGGSEQVVDMLNDRWLFSFDLPVKPTDAALLEAWLAGMRGMANTVNLWHFARPQPRGTLRGSPVLASTAAQGAASLSITTTTGYTLLAGDMLGVGSQLVQVESDCIASASLIVVPIVNRIRAAISAGAAVTWLKPVVPFRLMGSPVATHMIGYTEPVTLDFVEYIA